MIIMRGEIWLAELNPIRGSEQAGTRPVVILQNNSINRFTRTFLAIPLTTNLPRASLPTYVLLPEGEGGLVKDSAALCQSIKGAGQTAPDAAFGFGKRVDTGGDRSLHSLHYRYCPG